MIQQYDGQNGVELMIDILYQEFRRCMQLAGCRTIADITPDRLARIGSDGSMSRLQNEIRVVFA